MPDEEQSEEEKDIQEAQMSIDTMPTLQQRADAQDWVEVSSSNIAAIAYSAGYQVGVSWFYRELFIRFVSGKRYVYHEVNEAIWTAFLEAGSKGKYFNSSIKNHFPWDPIPD